MLDEIYTNFTTNLLPKIQEGLVITKDYFGDLFGRYVHYLIVTDIISIVFGLILFSGSVWGIKKVIKKNNEETNEYYKGDAYIHFIYLIPMLLIAIFAICLDINNLVKTLYIPEVRVLEELKNYKI